MCFIAVFNMLKSLPAPLTIETLTKGSTPHQLNLYNARYHGIPTMSNSRYGNGAPVSHLMSDYTNENQYLKVLNNTYNISTTVTHRVKHEKSNRQNVQKLTWRSSQWIRGFEEDIEDHSENQLSSLTITEVSPSVAIRRILLLYENLQYKEAANFISRLNYSTFKSILQDLPVDEFVESIPHSLPILEALYAKVFLTHSNGLNMKALKPENVVMNMVKLFALHNTHPIDNNVILPNFQEKFQGSLLNSCKKLLKVIQII